jgi:hypothetical protein
LKILLNSKDVSVFLASTELCQKIKEKSLSELFDYQSEVNIKIFNKTIIKKSPKEFNEINRLELINAVISEKLRELKKKEEENRQKEIQKLKELQKIKSLNARHSESKFSLNINYQNLVFFNLKIAKEIYRRSMLRICFKKVILNVWL